jgi:very-short-patch-repair endonuclease
MGLPRPAANVKLHLGGELLTVDFFWESAGLVIETDGEGTHGTPVAFRRDRKRDQLLLAAGFRVGRVTWDQMRDEPEGVVARIAAALRAGG